MKRLPFGGSDQPGPRHSVRFAVASIAAVVLALALQGQALAATPVWYVSPAGSDSNSCSSPASPCVTINGAISKASAGDTVDVAVGTYTGSGTNVVAIDRDLTLSGGWDSTFTQQTGLSTVDGQNAHRGVFVGVGASATVTRFEVMNGTPPSSPDPFAQGGGVLLYGPLTLDQSYIHDNVFDGVETTGAPLTITSSTIAGNQSGGVVFNNSFGSYTITITNSTIANNTGFYGAGISLAILGGSSASVLTLNSDTITANSATSSDPNSGGGIYAPAGWDIEMANTIVSGNTADFFPRNDIFASTVTSGGYNIGTGFTHTATDSYSDPALASLADTGGPTPTMALSLGSPAFDAIPSGVNGCGTTITTDQRGVARPQASGCDIGAFELVPPPALPAGSDDGASGLAKFPCAAAGWAQDPDSPRTHLNVRVLVDDVIVATTVADQFRQDLLDAGIGDGTFAFSVDLAALISTDTQHQVRVQAQDSQTGQWVDLDGTPKNLTCTQLAGSHDGNADIQPKSLCVATGWAWDADTPKTRLQVRVKVDGKVVAETTADQYRDDVRAAGFGDGYSGWTIKLFGLMSPRVPHLITAEERDSTLKRLWLPLDGTNIYLTCTPR